MMGSVWTEADAPRQDGRVFVVTGANSGIGLEASGLLAEKGAYVVMACRDPDKGARALERLRERIRDIRGEVMPLDLADTRRIRDFAEELSKRHARIDGLINNAGVMAIPRSTTAQGFEKQFGVNHLGHFVLTALLLDRIKDDGCVVTVSSEIHRGARIHFDDLMLERSYGRWKAYLQSKLANLLFTRELQRRLELSRPGVRAAACHPGYSATALQSKSGSSAEAWFMHMIGNRTVAQSARMGALPTLRAACDRTLPPNAYVGPKHLFRIRGYPELDTPSAAARDDASAQRLWQVSAELTGLDFATPSNV